MKKTRLLAFLLTACLATTCFLSGTVAKYSSKADGEDSARVAHWSFTVDPEGSNKDITKEDFVFDLFNTINDTDGGSEEADVKKETTPGENPIIAPGTCGNFKLILANTSEVNAKYKINFSITNDNNIPLEFQVVAKNGALNDNDWVAYGNIANCDVKGNDGNGVAINMDGSDEVTVYWRWQFERGDDDTAKKTNNEADTLLGVQGTAPTVTVTATITAEQVD